MSIKDFQLIHDTLFENSKRKRVFNKVYQQQEANLNNSDEKLISFLEKLPTIIK